MAEVYENKSDGRSIRSSNSDIEDGAKSESSIK